MVEVICFGQVPLPVEGFGVPVEAGDEGEALGDMPMDPLFHCTKAISKYAFERPQVLYVRARRTLQVHPSPTLGRGPCTELHNQADKQEACIVHPVDCTYQLPDTDLQIPLHLVCPL